MVISTLLISINPRSGNTSSISADLQENLDRLSDDCHQARDVVSKYEKELEDVRDQINDVKPSDPIAWLPNPKTIESEFFHSFYITVLLISFLVKLLNGTCTVTAAEDLTIKDACRRSNRFNGIDYDKARLEYYVTDTNHENKKVSLQQWKWSHLKSTPF